MILVAKGRIENISIKGLACALPTTRIASVSRYDDFGKEAVDKIIKKTGVESIYKTTEEQTASDLAYVAAKDLLEKKNIDIQSIGALILVTQTPDYRLPASACVLQYRLGLSEECICFDINLGCSGYINGLYAIASIMSNSNINRALLLVAETPTKRISPLDRSLSMLFGDCGTATLLEKDKDAVPMSFQFKTFGERFKKIIVPAGGYRNMNASFDRVMWADSNIRSDYDTYMNGQDVFSFSITEVPQFIKEFMSANNTCEADYDCIILHQANQYILKQIAKKLNADESKIAISMIHYGNTSSTSIPLTLAYSNTQEPKRKLRVLLSGFGVGLSWGSADVAIDTADILPIIHSNDYFKEGAVSHD
jgi:3-oxoacyl-[acyl-carrier-protein] synthase-3